MAKRIQDPPEGCTGQETFNSYYSYLKAFQSAGDGHFFAVDVRTILEVYELPYDNAQMLVTEWDGDFQVAGSLEEIQDILDSAPPIPRREEQLKEAVEAYRQRTHAEDPDRVDPSARRIPDALCCDLLGDTYFATRAQSEKVGSHVARDGFKCFLDED